MWQNTGKASRKIAFELSRGKKIRSEQNGVTVVLCVRNAEKTLSKCVNSLVEEGVPTSQILVVDGMSTDGSIEIAKSHGCIVISDEGKGFASARKMGIDASASAYTLILGPDDLMVPGSVATLKAELEESPELAAVAARKAVESTGRFLQKGMNSYYQSMPTGLVKTVGNPTLYKTDLLQKYSIDERFSANEDTDWCVRIRHAGFKISRSPNATALEIEDFNFNDFKKRWIWYGEGDLAFIQKWLTREPRKALRHLIHPTVEYAIRVPMHCIARRDLTGAVFSLLCWHFRNFGLLKSFLGGARFGRRINLRGR